MAKMYQYMKKVAPGQNIKNLQVEIPPNILPMARIQKLQLNFVIQQLKKM